MEVWSIDLRLSPQTHTNIYTLSSLAAFEPVTHAVLGRKIVFHKAKIRVLGTLSSILALAEDDNAKEEEDIHAHADVQQTHAVKVLKGGGKKRKAPPPHSLVLGLRYDKMEQTWLIKANSSDTILEVDLHMPILITYERCVKIDTQTNPSASLQIHTCTHTHTHTIQTYTRVVVPN